MNMCSLADVKALLDIGSGDTSQDAKLNLFIKRASAEIALALGYPVKRATYVDERHAVTNTQMIYLNAAPVQSISAISIDGVPVTDYILEPVYAKLGGVYRGLGWIGSYYVRGMTHDAFAGEHSILCSYVGGWYLPGETGYVEDEPTSLPTELSSAAMEATVEKYRSNVREGEGLKSYSEGGISYSFDKEAGLSEKIQKMLYGWMRGVVA